jgi:hypothetical protein
MKFITKRKIAIVNPGNNRLLEIKELETNSGAQDE